MTSSGITFEGSHTARTVGEEKAKYFLKAFFLPLSLCHKLMKDRNVSMGPDTLRHICEISEDDS